MSISEFDKIIIDEEVSIACDIPDCPNQWTKTHQFQVRYNAVYELHLCDYHSDFLPNTEGNDRLQ